MCVRKTRGECGVCVRVCQCECESVRECVWHDASVRGVTVRVFVCVCGSASACVCEWIWLGHV